MKKRIYIGLAAILMLLLLMGACGKRRSPARSATGPPTPELAQRQANAPQSTNNVFTAEDYTLMSMSYEERLSYLERKFKDLVFEMHGIRIEESISSARTVSGKDSTGHKVEENDPGTDEEHPERNRTLKERLALEIEGDNWQWTLSFRERVQGDYNFDHAVSIADITPLAMHYGHAWDVEVEDEWNCAVDPHIDRLSNEDGKIGIADITPIAMNYGLRLKVEPEEEPVGYNVYYAPVGTMNWTTTPVFFWNADAYREPPPQPYDKFRAKWEGQFDRFDLLAHEEVIELSANDQLSLKPVFNTGEGNEDTRSDIVKLELPPNLPTAVLQVIDPPGGDPPTKGEDENFVFDASDSEVWDGNWDDFGLFKYEFNFGDGSDPYVFEPLDPFDRDNVVRATHAYSEGGHVYKVKLTIYQQDRENPPNVVKGYDWVNVRVLGDPIVYHFYPELNPVDNPGDLVLLTGEVINEVTYFIKAEDVEDGAGISHIYISYDGTANPEDPEEWELIYDGPVVQSKTMEHKHEFGRDDLVEDLGEGEVDVQDKEFNSTLMVVRDGGQQKRVAHLSDNLHLNPYCVGPEFKLRRACPDLELFTTPPWEVFTANYGDGNPQTAEYYVVGVLVDTEVTFEASNSTDSDGPEHLYITVFPGYVGMPTEFEFDFGEGPSTIQSYYYYDDPLLPGYGTASHTYSQAGKYTATIYARDDDYYEELADVTEEERHELHEDSMEIEVWVYGPPVPSIPTLVDDGVRVGGEWIDLGNPSIAIDIDVLRDPVSEDIVGIPGIAYYSGELGPVNVHAPSPYFVERINDLWSIPEIVALFGGELQTNHVGVQCDLMYDLMHNPWIAATWDPPMGIEIGLWQRGDILLYNRLDGDWYRTELLDKGYMAVHDSPIRLIVATNDNVVHYRDFTSQELREASFINAPSAGDTVQADAGRSHDAKPWMNIVIGDPIAGTAYTNLAGLYYETNHDAPNWDSVPYTISNSQSISESRLVALDYYTGDSGYFKYGVLWIESNGALMFIENDNGVWLIPQTVAPAAVSYCDFDYASGGYPIAAFDMPTPPGQPHQVKVAARMGTESNDWLIVPVDTLAVDGDKSYLDMDAFDGYVYVAYSKLGDLYCAVLDMLGR